MPRSPHLRSSEPYPFERLDRKRAEVAALGVPIIDLGVGDPRERTPDFIRQGLIDALEPVSSYPRAAGLPELREAIAAWTQRRFGVRLNPGRDIIPTLGSKEIVFSLAQDLLDPAQGKDLVIVTVPGYTVPERGARFAGGDVRRLPLTEANDFLPDLDAVDAATWARAAVVWVNYPNNPTGAVAPLGFYEQLAELARSFDFSLASDEAYVELYFTGEPPVSALELPDLRNVLSVHTLSKRSSMTGYRSGFIAGDADLLADLRSLRPATGVTPQEFVQRASALAWGDDEHVKALRKGYGVKRDLFLELFARKQIHVAASEAAFYLWVGVPGGQDSESFGMGLLERGIVVAPGSFFGPEGEGYVRMAMVPTLEDCARAASILDELL